MKAHYLMCGGLIKILRKGKRYALIMCVLLKIKRRGGISWRRLGGLRRSEN